MRNEEELDKADGIVTHWTRWGKYLYLLCASDEKNSQLSKQAEKQD